MPRSFISRIARDRLVTATTGTVSADGAILGHDHRLRAEGVRAAQARPEVVRIGHSVEHQQQRWSLSRFEDVVQRDVRQRVVDDRHHALVLPMARKCEQPRGIDRMHAYVRRVGPRDEIAQARILPAGKHIEIVHGVRALAQAGGDRVKAEQGAGGGHQTGFKGGDTCHGGRETMW
jgi:hypothetical protein